MRKGRGRRSNKFAAQEQLARQRLFAAGKGLRAADNLPREALHDRDALR
jgi:hypothetical protein